MSREEQMMAWMDDMVDSYESYMKTIGIGREKGIDTVTLNKMFHIQSGIGIIADAIGMKLEKQEYTEDFDKLSILYRGYEFISLIRRP